MVAGAAVLADSTSITMCCRARCVHRLSDTATIVYIVILCYIRLDATL